MLAAPRRRGRPNVEDIWLFLHLLFEAIWKYRFLYRDLNDLLSRNRLLEIHFKRLLEQQGARPRPRCATASLRAGEMHAQHGEITALATNMVVVATYWLSYEYVRNPRNLQEGEMLARGAYQVMSLVAPFLADALARAVRAAGRGIRVILIGAQREERWQRRAGRSFPIPTRRTFTTARALKKHWDRLHRGDCEPFPKDEAVAGGVAAYHAGRLRDRRSRPGSAAGVDGYERRQQGAGDLRDLSREVGAEEASSCSRRRWSAARRRCGSVRKDANAHYFYAMAAGRYSQEISVAKALAQGLGGKIKEALDQALKLQPKHADAHIALGTWHAEIIGKVGAMVGGLTYGAKKDAARRALPEGAQAQPGFGDRAHRVRERSRDCCSARTG